MFDLINGIPIHPLVVHAVVVLLPLAILGAIALAVRPGWRHRYGWLVVAAAALSVVLTPIATSSGEALEKRVGDPGGHAALGDQLIWFEIPLLLLTVALVVLDRRRVRAEGDATSTAPKPRALTAVSVLAVLMAVAAGVQVYRVGDSGAKAAWGDAVTGDQGGAQPAKGGGGN